MTKTKPMTDEWVKEFRAKYTVLVKYEKWPNEEPQLLPEPNWRWTDEAMYNPGIIIGEIDRLLTQATSKAREEALEQVVKLLPKRTLSSEYNKALENIEDMIQSLKKDK